MKPDWDVIREVLIEVEALSEQERNTFGYGLGCVQFWKCAIRNAGSPPLGMLESGPTKIFHSATTDPAVRGQEPSLEMDGHASR